MNFVKSILRANLNSNFNLPSIRHLTSNRASIVRTNRLQYLRPYPTLLVNPDGSTITIRYHEPRQIIKLPFDLTPLSEEEKAIHLQRRKPKTRVKIVEDSERVEFDSKKYRKYMKK